MASDIKKIVDAVAARPESIEKFARLVSKEEIRRNGYMSRKDPMRSI